VESARGTGDATAGPDADGDEKEARAPLLPRRRDRHRGAEGCVGSRKRAHPRAARDLVCGELEVEDVDVPHDPGRLRRLGDDGAALLQPLNAWAFAAIAGVGLPLFQQMIPRPGLSTGLYMNTRRIGSIVSGPLIALGSLTVLGNRGIFLACATVTAVALGVISVASQRPASRPSDPLPN
jgi:hypothetical protein